MLLPLDEVSLDTLDPPDVLMYCPAASAEVAAEAAACRLKMKSAGDITFGSFCGCCCC